MCACVTTWQIVAMINERREKNGLDSMPYQIFMIKWNTVRKWLPAEGKIGPAYTFRKSTARRIANTLWDSKYNTQPYSKYLIKMAG
jgi:hypothetical protein